MNFSQLLSSFPLWGLFVGAVLIICLSFEGGFLFGKHQCRRSQKEKDSPIGPMIGATLGLLAFMLSFTFGMAASHFFERQQTVLAEVAAIRSTYALTGLVSEASREKVRKLLREYVDIRSNVRSAQELKSTIIRSEEIHDLLWTEAISGEIKSSGASSSWVFVQSLNDMINLHFKRLKIGLGQRIPSTIWIVLYGLAILAIAGMGYHAGLFGHRGSFAYLVLILTFSGVLVLITDLDRSRQGLFKVSQQPMIDLQKKMNLDKL
ncbi:MAG: hypothetical protein WCX16_01095 [Candidatus Omnitrophota bacterium]